MPVVGATRPLLQHVPVGRATRYVSVTCPKHILFVRTICSASMTCPKHMTVFRTTRSVSMTWPNIFLSLEQHDMPLYAVMCHRACGVSFWHGSEGHASWRKRRGKGDTYVCHPCAVESGLSCCPCERTASHKRYIGSAGKQVCVLGQTCKRVLVVSRTSRGYPSAADV